MQPLGHLHHKKKRKNDPEYKAVVDIYQGDAVWETGYCIMLMVPFPSRVMIAGNAVIESSIAWLKRLQSQNVLLNKDLVLRPFLIRSNRYKELLLRRQDMSSRVRAIYRGLSMPRYVWIVEYGYLEDWIGANPNQRQICGELIFDSTSATGAQSNPLILHVPSLVLVEVGEASGNSPSFEAHLLSDVDSYDMFSPQAAQP